jgi:tripartite ATP-independent transporter DctM subunit
MEWWLILVIVFGAVLGLMALGIPVAFSFLLVNLGGAIFLWGGEVGLQNLITSVYRSVTTFSLLPLPLFVFMGEILAHSGVATRMIDTVDQFLGGVRARLSLLAVAGGVLIGALSGSTPGAAAILGEAIAPDMEKRGYKKPMVIGPIIGSAGLAIIIPPSGMAVFLACMGNISVGKLLIAGILPGLVMAVFYAAFIVIRCRMDPSLAPSYSAPAIPLGQKIISFIRDVLPLGFIVLCVTGFILLGIATPSEAAAAGSAAAIILAAAYGSLRWKMLKKVFSGTLNIAGMMFMIFLGAIAFSQILAYTGATKELVYVTSNLPVSPILVVILMQLIVLLLGMFLEQTSIMMITLPIFMPIVSALGFNEVWFGLITLINLGIGNRTPPVGFLLFVMKSISPPDTTMVDIYRAATPYILLDVIVMLLVMFIPQLALWIPQAMG